MTDTLIEYFEHQLKFEQQYGPKTIVLAQYGTFYDAFQYIVNHCTSDEAKIDKYKTIWSYDIGCACDTHSLLDCDLTQKNNNKPYGIKNPHMFGFPAVSYDKNLKILLANDYVVVKLNQKDDEKNSKGQILRYVAEIVSPSMSFNNLSTTITSANIVSIYIEYMSSKYEHQCDGYVIACGVSLLDLVTGDNFISEFYSKHDDEVYCLQEIYRFLTFYHPKEIIININDLPEHLSSDVKINPYVKYLEQNLELKRYDRYIFLINKVKPEYKKLNYQTEFFNKLFVDNMQKNNKILQDLDLSKYNYGRLAYILLIQYCHENNGPTENLEPPLINQFTQEKKLVLTHNAAICLEVIATRKKKNEINSLFSIVDNTTTHLGTRCLEYLLLNPMSDKEEIEKYYNMVDEFSNTYNDELLWLNIEKRLMGLPDISRLQRKIELKIITSKEIALLLKSYGKVLDMIQYLHTLPLKVLKTTMSSILDLQAFENFYNYFNNKFNESLECCYYDQMNSGKKSLEFEQNPLKNNDVFNEKFLLLTDYQLKLDTIVNHLNTFLTKGNVKIACKNINKKGKLIKGQVKYDSKLTLLLTTTTNANKLSSCSINEDLCGKIQVSPYTVGDKVITSSLIESLIQKKDDMKSEIAIKLAEYIDETIYELLKHVKLFTPLCNLIGLLDVLHNYAKISFKNKYYRPTIIDAPQSFMKIKKLRHPVAERIIDNQYITNDIELGKQDDNDDSPYGMLLYGVNASGKSLCLKALGLIIIMAQTGCYVPGYLTFCPYKKIITRLSTQDNLFKSESLFEVEMNELKTMLVQSDQYTLGLADELASSTESISATCLTTSAILSLVAKKTNFLFTSHNHELSSLKYITEMPEKLLSIKHLSISYDEETKTLIYDRILKDTSGPSYYGILVSKYLKLPIDFITKAEEISLYLDEENKEYLSTKKSRHNSKVYMDKCKFCHTTKNLITHHIQEQQYAINNYINDMHKNHKSNLIVLCEDCHMKKIHLQHKELEVLQTINGNIVKFKK
jgi:DNA mismatch repair protein MutS